MVPNTWLHHLIYRMSCYFQKNRKKVLTWLHIKIRLNCRYWFSLGFLWKPVILVVLQRKLTYKCKDYLFQNPWIPEMPMCVNNKYNTFVFTYAGILGLSVSISSTELLSLLFAYNLNLSWYTNCYESICILSRATLILPKIWSSCHTCGFY